MRSCAESGSGSTRWSVSPAVSGAVPARAIASTTKSTGTTLNGAPAEPNCTIGWFLATERAIARSM